jgi:glycyl-tRNA synthetase beta chain
LLREEGQPEAVWRAVYEHYQPAGPGEAVPSTEEGSVVSVADKLESIETLCRAGEEPSGSRDPFGLRRAANGVFRITVQRRWPLSLDDFSLFTEQSGGKAFSFLSSRFQTDSLRGLGFTQHEINAVLHPQVGQDSLGWPLHDVVDRLEALRGVRQRDDFSHLVDLTKRVSNIVVGNQEALAAIVALGSGAGYQEGESAARDLAELVQSRNGPLSALEQHGRYTEVIDVLAEFVRPVDRFFSEVLVIDPAHPEATAHRYDLLARLKNVLTRCFDIRELAGQADRSS